MGKEPTTEVAEEEPVEPEQVVEETVETSPDNPVADDLGADEEPVKEEAKARTVTMSKEELDALLNKAGDQAVGKAQSAWTKRLQESARLEAELKFYREQHEKLTGRKPEPEKDEVAELRNSEDFALMPKRIQEELIAGAEARRELRRETQENRKFREESASQRARDMVEMVVDDMKADTENYPGFEQMIPQIRAEAETDPDLLNGLITNPKRWLPRIYKSLSAPIATELAEKALDKKIKEQVRAKTAASSARESGTKKYKSPQEAFEAAKAELGITDENAVVFG